MTPTTPQGGAQRGGMAAAATVRLAMADATAAERAARSLAADNGGHLACRAEGSVLVLHATSPSPLGLLRTLEDALNGLRAAGLA